MNELIKRLDRLEVLTLLAAKSVLTLEEVCLLTGLAKSTVYKMTANRVIPHYHADGGKHLYFKKMRWKTGSHETECLHITRTSRELSTSISARSRKEVSDDWSKSAVNKVSCNTGTGDTDSDEISQV